MNTKGNKYGGRQKGSPITILK